MITIDNTNDHGLCDARNCESKSELCVLTDSGYPLNWFCSEHYAEANKES